VVTCAVVVCFCASLIASEQKSADPGEATILIHCEWERPANRSIEIRFEGGVRLLSVFQPTESISETFVATSTEPTNEIRIQTDNPTTSLLAELRCSVSGRGMMTTRVREGDQDLGEKQFSFEELLSQRTELTFPGNTGKIAIWRKPGDELQIQSLHSHLVFSRNEIYQGVAAFNFGTPPERRSRPVLNWSICENRSRKELSAGSIPFTIPRRNNSSTLHQAFALNVPNRDGAYELHVVLADDSGRQLGKTIIPIAVHSGQGEPTKNSRSESGYGIGSAIHDPNQILDLISDREIDFYGKRSTTDWTTMFQFVRELADRVEQNGLNSLLLGVNSNGVSLYPTNSVNENSIRFDNGRCHPEAPDPLVKDVLELVFREFDRRRLTLIPELDLTAPDPILDAIDTEAKSLTAKVRVKNSSSAGPRYDALHPTVQNRILEIHRELVRRYSHHESFGGVSLSIHDMSWASLSGNDQQQTGVVRERSRRISNVSLAMNEDAESAVPMAETVDPHQEAQELADRCRRLAGLYQKMAKVLAETRSDSRLYLSTHRLVASERFQREVLNVIHSGRAMDSLLTIRGIEPRLLEFDDRIVLLRPFCSLTPSVAGETRIAASGINSSSTFNQTTAPWRGAINVMLKGKDDPNQPNRSQLLDGYLTHALTDLNSGHVFIDFETIPETSERTSTEQLIEKLPNTMFVTVPDVRQPIVVRRALVAEKTYLYAVNESPLSAQVTFSVNAPEQISIEPLTRDSACKTTYQDQVESWAWSLEPFSAKGCLIDSPKCDITQVETVVDTVALNQLKQRLNGLEASVNRTELRPNSVRLLIPNADFESVTDGGGLPPGWNYRHSRELPPMLDTTAPHTGTASLLIEKQSADQAVGISSFPLSIDQVENLTISFWGRCNSTDLSLTLGLTGDRGGNRWSKDVHVHPEQRWQQFVFRVTDLPRDLSNVCFFVTLNEPGKVWLDDFEMFPQPLTPEDERRLMRAIATIRLAWQEERYADCARLIDGYWGRFLTSPPPISVNGEQHLPQIGSRFRDLIVR